ncbi:hypothetical protein A9Q84_11280 [Halobacteriovorax marinus]|uniref:DUF2938 domain-containing protein n=1 Tax=Halobacteriovorax marinus TaxID=97084 RepID=A0A1Y5FDG2_9BACT|nr:hypothetical protein A9Q84_11280 [Halobacteriovorax marinus]
MSIGTIEIIIEVIFIGVGATLFMDLWSLVLRKIFNIKGLNYEMVGRWIGHLPKGKFRHQRIDQANKVIGEKFIGWSSHYIIGIIFSALLISLWGVEWISSPSLIPALIIGISTVLAPFLILQPALGAGVFAKNTPKPNIARLKSIMAHTSYGLGLYLSGRLLSVIV